MLCKPLIWLGFINIEYYYVHGSGQTNKLILGKNVSTANAIFNISCGNIFVGDNTIFGHSVCVLTGFHRFYKGKLAKLSLDTDAPKEVPLEGNDINIGSGCFIGSRAIILRNVSIGDNSIVASGAIVTKSVPAGSFVAGIPAKLVTRSL